MSVMREGGREMEDELRAPARPPPLYPATVAALDRVASHVRRSPKLNCNSNFDKNEERRDSLEQVR